MVIAGAGVGGLALANAFHGVPHVKTTVLEKTSKFKRFGGPIQLASNAMQVLREMDGDMYDNIEGKATFTGNLTNGIKDGIRNEWCVEAAPALRLPLPLPRPFGVLV